MCDDTQTHRLTSANTARTEAREEAAQVAEEIGRCINEKGDDPSGQALANTIAAAIRSQAKEG